MCRVCHGDLHITNGPGAPSLGIMFLGENLLAYLVLALGGALAVGNILALVKPPESAKSETDLQKAPIARSVVMAAVGTVAAIWAVASLLS